MFIRSDAARRALGIAEVHVALTAEGLGLRVEGFRAYGFRVLGFRA